jgi:glycosyltransferase involved in cell wall biosynthesis
MCKPAVWHLPGKPVLDAHMMPWIGSNRLSTSHITERYATARGLQRVAARPGERGPLGPLSALPRVKVAPAIARRILICFHDFPRGGTERIAIGLARQWCDRGHEVTILCGSGEGDARADVDPRVRVIELNPPIPRSLFSRVRLGPAMARMIARLDPDVIFLPGNFHMTLVPAFSKIPDRGALVIKISNPALPRGLVRRPARWVMERYHGSVDGVAAMNAGLARDLAEMLPGIKVRTLYDPAYLAPVIEPARPPQPDGCFEIVWAGRFEPQKDVPLALATIVALNRRIPAHLTMLGDGAGLAAARQQIARMGLEEMVATPGHVPGIDHWLQGAGALLVTSHFEGGPAVAVEALAHGIPVVSTDCSPFLSELLSTAESGKIVGTRNPEALADALLAVRAAGVPDPVRLAGLIAHLAPGPCADAYLEWFETLAVARGR